MNRLNLCKIARRYAGLVLLFGISVICSCKRNAEFPVPPSGIKLTSGADFSHYIAVGNSMTAGFADGGLYREGQLTSFPNILAQQMQKVGGGNFTQPVFGTTEVNGSGYLKLSGLNPDGTPILANVTINLGIRGTYTAAGRTVTLYTKHSGNNNNYGVPGIKLADINNPDYGNLNGYFERLLPNNAPNNNATYLDHVTRQPFTFFTNWLGNNDALSFATTGGMDTLTSTSYFEKAYNVLLTKLTAKGAKGVVVTIPDVTVIPYLNTITAGSILLAAQKLNPAAKIYITTASGTAREAKATDLFRLDLPIGKLGTGAQPYGLSVTAPIENQYVLDEAEVALARQYVAAYNATIKKLAAAKGLAVFDAYAFLNTLKSGITVNGVVLNTAYLSGGVFSLDGIHLTPRGYALIANKLIEAINSTYSTNLTQVDVSLYRTVKTN